MGIWLPAGSQFFPRASGSRYNNSLALLRHILQIGVESGVIYSNPATSLDRVTMRPNQLKLPTREKFVEFVEEIKRGA